MKNQFQNTGGTFGEWFRNLRISKGLAAYKISEKAGLDSSYLSQIERGKALPKADKISKLAAAMGLTKAERDELEARAVSGKPTMIKVAVPGLAIWKHLPESLFQVPHELFGYQIIDDVMPDAVRFFAALLGSVALTRKMLTNERRAAVIAALAERVTAAEDGEALTAKERWGTIRYWVISAWRQVLFVDEEAAADLAGLLKEWMYVHRASKDWTVPTFSGSFAKPALDRAWRAEYVSLSTGLRVYNLFTASWLFNDTAIGEVLTEARRIAPKPDEWSEVNPVIDAFVDLERLGKLSKSELIAECGGDADRIMERSDVVSMAHVGRCLYELPAAARDWLPQRANFDRWLDNLGTRSLQAHAELTEYEEGENPSKRRATK